MKIKHLKTITGAILVASLLVCTPALAGNGTKKPPQEESRGVVTVILEYLNLDIFRI